MIRHLSRPLASAIVVAAFILIALAAGIFARDSGGTVGAQVVGGPVFVSGDDAEDHCYNDLCGGLMVAVFNSALDLSLSPGNGILAIGMTDADAVDALDSWNDPAFGGPDVAITTVTGAAISTVDFADFDVIFVPSNENDGDERGITNADLALLNERSSDIADFVNVLGGGLIALTEQDADPSLAFGFLPIPLEFENIDYTDAEPTAAMADLAPLATAENMSHDLWHNVWTGPEGYGGLDVLATAVIPEEEERPDLDGMPAILGGAHVILRTLISLDPPTATNTIGEDHTVIATINDFFGDPSPDVDVTFEVIDGPNAGDTGAGTTDADGEATFTYTGDGGAGTDTIEACFLDEQEQEHCDTATKTWVAPEPTPTATAVPTQTAVAGVSQLPRTGGQPTGDTGPLSSLAVALAAIALAGGGVWLAYQRRRAR